MGNRQRGKPKPRQRNYPEEICVERGGERTWKRCEERSGKTDGNRTQTRVDKGGEIRGGSCIGTWRELDARKGKEAENAKGGETPLEREDEVKRRTNLEAV